MKRFNLEEYLANPSREVVTRDGHSVRILCTDARNNNYPIVALVSLKGGTEILCGYTKEGTRLCDKIHLDDLFFATKKREGWINMYRNSDGISWLSHNYFMSKAEAEKEGKTHTCSVTTIKIEWEE